jgi:hypothetical protein
MRDPAPRRLRSAAERPDPPSNHARGIPKVLFLELDQDGRDRARQRPDMAGAVRIGMVMACTWLGFWRLWLG